MEKHFVQFFSPGTLTSETTTKEIDSWDVNQAVKMADDVVERHGATPYGFKFITRSRGPDDLDSSITARSNFYYLGGQIETIEEIIAKEDPKDTTLIVNMETNNYKRVITINNSYRSTFPFNDDDVVINYIPPHRR